MPVGAGRLESRDPRDATTSVPRHTRQVPARAYLPYSPPNLASECFLWDVLGLSSRIPPRGVAGLQRGLNHSTVGVPAAARLPLPAHTLFAKTIPERRVAEPPGDREGGRPRSPSHPHAWRTAHTFLGTFRVTGSWGGRVVPSWLTHPHVNFICI